MKKRKLDGALHGPSCRKHVALRCNPQTELDPFGGSDPTHPTM